MRAHDMLPLLQAWARRNAELEAQMDALAAIFGRSFDGPLFDAVWGTWNDYTRALSRIVGDDEDWLGWFESECDMGKRPQVVTSAGGRTIKVRTVAQLARVIEFNRSAE